MRHELTPAAERVLRAAADYARNTENNGLELAALLLGLLDEPECRAAQLLADHGIDERAIRENWNASKASDARGHNAESHDAPRVEVVLQAAENRLYDYPRPLALATEHLLLGLLAIPGDVAAWLESRGLNADELEAEIHRVAGHERGPIEWQDDDAIASAASFSPQPSALSPPPSPGQPSPVLRIIDAAANRAAEGLRVVEDYVRFVLDDRNLTQQLKNLRHELAAALDGFAVSDRLASRESQSDVGTTTKTSAEFARPDLAAVLAANFQRAQQAFRSLEEFAKLTEPPVASKIERLRYRLYTLQRAVDSTRTGLARLANARLYVLIDGRPTEVEFQHLAEQLVAAGVDVVQLRDKQLGDRELLARARVLRSVTRGSDTLFIMNDRPDLAMLADADGVHVGQDELTVKDARQIVGPRMLVGVSTHSIEQAWQAVLDGANYIGVGPTFASSTKTFTKFPGLDFVGEVAKEIRLPAFAIGGITLDNLPQVLTAGATRIAVSAALVESNDPKFATHEFLTALYKSQ